MSNAAKKSHKIKTEKMSLEYDNYKDVYNQSQEEHSGGTAGREIVLQCLEG